MPVVGRCVGVVLTSLTKRHSRYAQIGERIARQALCLHLPSPWLIGQCECGGIGGGCRLQDLKRDGSETSVVACASPRRTFSTSLAASSLGSREMRKMPSLERTRTSCSSSHVSTPPDSALPRTSSPWRDGQRVVSRQATSSLGVVVSLAARMGHLCAARDLPQLCP